MKPFLFVRDLTDAEDAALRDAVRSDDPFARRRATVIRLSARRQRLDQIADALAISLSGARRGVGAGGGGEHGEDQQEQARHRGWR